MTVCTVWEDAATTTLECVDTQCEPEVFVELTGRAGEIVSAKVVDESCDDDAMVVVFSTLDDDVTIRVVSEGHREPGDTAPIELVAAQQLIRVGNANDLWCYEVPLRFLAGCLQAVADSQ